MWSVGSGCCAAATSASAPRPSAARTVATRRRITRNCTLFLRLGRLGGRRRGRGRIVPPADLLGLLLGGRRDLVHLALRRPVVAGPFGQLALLANLQRHAGNISQNSPATTRPPSVPSNHSDTAAGSLARGSMT